MQPFQEKLAGMRVLVVEDELYVALEIEDVLQALDCKIAGPVSTVMSAIVGIEQEERLNGVFLDLNLHGESALPVAQVLVEKGIPFILVTGYPSSPKDPPVLRGAPRVTKPFTLERIGAAMMDTFSR